MAGYVEKQSDRLLLPSVVRPTTAGGFLDHKTGSRTGMGRSQWDTCGTSRIIYLLLAGIPFGLEGTKWIWYPQGSHDPGTPTRPTVSVIGCVVHYCHLALLSPPR